jgi:hypothetical protein
VWQDVGGRGELRHPVCFRGPPTGSNDDSPVLAGVVRISHAYDDPRRRRPVEKVTRLEDEIGEPILPMPVGIDDGQVARQLRSFRTR